MGLGALVGLGSGIVFPHMHFMVLVGEDRGGVRGVGLGELGGLGSGIVLPCIHFMLLANL